MSDAEIAEIDINHDDLVGKIELRMREEYARQSDAGESAADTREFLDKTGLNSQAFSWLKSICKKIPKKDGTVKAMDIIQSLEVGLPMIKAHIEGQNPPLPLDDDGVVPFDPAEATA